MCEGTGVVRPAVAQDLAVRGTGQMALGAQSMLSGSSGSVFRSWRMCTGGRESERPETRGNGLESQVPWD